LEHLRQQEFEIESKALDELVLQKLLDADAKKKGITGDKLLEMEVDANVTDPTPGEVEAYYLAQEGTHLPGIPKEVKTKLKERSSKRKSEPPEELI